MVNIDGQWVNVVEQSGMMFLLFVGSIVAIVTIVRFVLKRRKREANQ